MLLAHLPSGYILSTFFRSRKTKIASIIGSVFPDLDMFYFYLIDQRQTNHHDYWFHIPIFWLSLFILLNTFKKLTKLPFSDYINAFFCGILLHLCLDSITGHINWLLPFHELSIQAITIPPFQSHWILSYFLHWSVWFEIIIIFTACYFLFRAKYK